MSLRNSYICIATSPCIVLITTSTPQVILAAIIFYECRRGTEATATVRNRSQGDDIKYINIVIRHSAHFKEGDTGFDDKPRSGRRHAVEDSAILDAERGSRRLALLSCDKARLHPSNNPQSPSVRWIQNADSMDPSRFDR